MFTFILEECSELNKTIRRPNWGCWSAPWTFSGFSYGSLCFCYYSCTYVSPPKFDITIAARNTKSTSSPITNMKFANIKRWTNTTWVTTQRDNMLETARTVLCATCVTQGSQILTCWRNACSSMSKVFAKSVKSSSTWRKIQNDTEKSTKFKGAKTVAYILTPKKT